MIKFSREPIGEKLVKLHRDAEERDAQRRAGMEKLPYLDIRTQPINPSALELVPESLAKEAKAIIFSTEKNKVGVGAYTSKSNEFSRLSLFLEEKKLKPEIFIVSLKGLQEAWAHYASIRTEDKEEIVSELKLNEDLIEKRVSANSIQKASANLVRIDQDFSTTEALTEILIDAITLGASDIHLETGGNQALIRFRIDGILYDLAKISNEIHQRLVGRLKLLANLKLNVKDKPQDGRFTVKRKPSDIEIRLSVVPAEHGESLVLRVLNPEFINLNLADLGLREDDEEIIREAIKQPNGMVLVTGPTGSGKTTTLYAFLKENNSPEVKIITVEDPIEYHLEGVEQTQIRPADGYTFTSGLRSILRQDPDVILVGEIRDKETAKTAIDAALTGHLVFSTLHTNSAPGAIPRLVDLGVKAGVLAPAINLVLAQRLVRKLCDKCKQPLPKNKETDERIKDFYSQLPQRVRAPRGKNGLYRNVGCPRCLNGFKGRTGVFELMVLSGDFEENIGSIVNEAKARKYARGQGMVYMQEDGILKALSGTTTLGEVEKVTGPIKWPPAKLK